jgi:hypothetical protein
MALSEAYLDSDDLHPIDIVEHIAATAGFSERKG